MARVAYLFGAGASIGNNQNIKPIEYVSTRGLRPGLEGIPIVENFNRDVFEFLKVVKLHFDNEKLHNRLENIFVQMEDSFSFDTFARKLFLKGENENLEYLRQLLNSYLIFRETNSKVDKRYELFLATILKNNGEFNQDYLFISYNYDIQFERAISAFSMDSNFGSKISRVSSSQSKFNPYQGKLIKMNGSAVVVDKSNHIDHNYTSGQFSKILDFEDEKSFLTNQYARFSIISNRGLGIRFSWEQDKAININAFENELQNIEALICIGYSFPSVNKESDLLLLNKMLDLQEVYLQVGNSFNEVESRLSRILQSKIEYKPTIVNFSDTSQFLTL